MVRRYNLFPALLKALLGLLLLLCTTSGELSMNWNFQDQRWLAVESEVREATARQGNTGVVSKV